ncbi:Hypothetical predicted protein [Pelobates cultripes]|uniref:Uncharacterized protein n=1 Tax=Pelobates cultripes TaxID=61616 RepID=A0AAD1VMH0_PELCU|nr:Hypothetical predicted protein [Pelobates cultripes]
MSTKLIQTWQTKEDQIRKEVVDLIARTTHVESQCKEIAVAHTNMADQVQALHQRLDLMESHLADLEDKARRNILRLRGIPESVLPCNLQVYVQDVPADMVQVDQVHRVPKPHYLPDSTPIDVLLREHYFHIKKIIMKSRRNKPLPHEDCPTVRIMVDLSTATLRRKK